MNLMKAIQVHAKGEPMKLVEIPVPTQSRTGINSSRSLRHLSW